MKTALLSRQLVVYSALMGLAISVACAPAAAPTPTSAPKAAEKPAATPAAIPVEKSATGPLDKPRVSQQIIEAANREGQLRLYWTSTATEQWKQRFEDAFNQFYGTRISISQTLGNDWARDTAKVVSETSAGQKPAWDLMMVTETHYNDLYQAGLLSEYDWAGMFGVPQRAIMFKGGAFVFAHQVAIPSYNTELVKGADIPKRWEDLLEPRFKEKIGVHTATHHWARLSQVWGDEKTTQFVQKLAAQNPKLGTPASVLQSLQLGEIHIVATQIDNQLRDAQKRGAPVAWAEAVSPMLLQSLVTGPLKGAANPNAALLFAGFLASKQGQQLWEEFQGQSSAFVEGSPTWKLVQGKEYVVLNEEFMAKELAERTAKYGRMLGFR